MTPEKMAINKHRLRLLASYKFKEAAEIGELPEEEAVKLLPKGALDHAKKMWDAAHAGRFKAFDKLEERVLPATPPCPLLPESTEEES